MKEVEERIEHIFRFMEYDNLTENEENLVIDYEQFFQRNGRLTENQYEVLEQIFKRASER